MFRPFAHYGIDEKAARIVGALVGVLAAATIFLTPSVQLTLTALLVADISARAFSRPDLSILTNVARRVLWFLSIPPRRVDAAPKRFAARVGLGLVAVMVLANATESRRVLLVSSMLLALLALLEAGLNFSTILWKWTHHHVPKAGTPAERLRAG